MDSDQVEFTDQTLLFAALTVPCVGFLFANMIVLRELDGLWFRTLKVPKWDPPPIVHMVVWLSLHLLLGFASFCVWKDGGGFRDEVKSALVAYGVTLVVSWIYVPIFFESHNIRMAYYVSTTNLALAALLTFMFYRVSLKAALLTLPFLVWLMVSVKTMDVIVRMNPKIRSLSQK